MSTKVTICIGLNDKATKRQEITTAAAKTLIQTAVVKYFGFGTVSDCTGVYTHGDGTNTIVQETTIKVELTFFDLDKATAKNSVMPFVLDMKTALNQETIYVDLSTVDAFLF